MSHALMWGVQTISEHSLSEGDGGEKDNQPGGESCTGRGSQVETSGLDVNTSITCSRSSHYALTSWITQWFTGCYSALCS